MNQMKDYDEDVRDLEGVTRPFKLRGVELEAKPTMSGKQLSIMADIQSGERSGGLYESAVAAIRDTLVDASRGPWDELMARDDLAIPITIEALMTIVSDLVEQATGRPPTPPSPSGSTGERTTTKSTDGFSSTVAPPSPHSMPVRS